MRYFIYFKKLAEECVCEWDWEGDVRTFRFWEGSAEGGFYLERGLHSLCLPGVSLILRVNTEIVKLLVWATTWSCSLIEYRLYNEVLSSKSSE